MNQLNPLIMRELQELMNGLFALGVTLDAQAPLVRPAGNETASLDMCGGDGPIRVGGG